MELTKRLIGNCGTLIAGEKTVELDYPALIRRLILFDTYYIKTTRLKELPLLLKIFGHEGLANLLQSKVLRMHCDAFTIGQTGQTTVLKAREKKGALPLGSYAFSIVSRTNWDEYIQRCFNDLIKDGLLSAEELKKLDGKIEPLLVNYPDDFEKDSLRQLKTDLTNNSPIVKKMVINTLRKRFGGSDSYDNIQFQVEQIDETDYRVATNIATIFSLEQKEVHKIIERDLLAIGGFNQRIEEMRVFNAVSGFNPEEVQLFGEKLGFIMEQINPSLPQEKFQRILNIKGIPETDRLYARTIDVDKLLSIRESVECCEFRNWLSTVDELNDKDIKEKLTRLREKLTELVQTKIGRDVRFLAVTGVGAIPLIGSVAGPVLGALDHFLLDKIFPYSGPATFINRLYPSIFKK